MANLSASQRNDPILSLVHNYLQTSQTPPMTGNWNKFPLKRYGQLRSQLLLHDSVIYRKLQSSSMVEEKLLIVVPKSQRKTFLTFAHDDSGHQRTDCTMARLSEMVYWVGMGKDTAHYCTHCFTCQVNKAPEQTPAPL